MFVYTFRKILSVKMPYSQPESFLKLSDCPIFAPVKYPGLFTKWTPSGTHLSRDDWRKEQARKWVNMMQSSHKEKYIDTPFGNKTKILKEWMSRTFSKMSNIYIKKVLMEIEKNLEDDTYKSDSETESDEMTEQNDNADRVEELMQVDEIDNNDSDTVCNIVCNAVCNAV